VQARDEELDLKAASPADLRCLPFVYPAVRQDNLQPNSIPRSVPSDIDDAQ
jgi:hypothetical protein